MLSGPCQTPFDYVLNVPHDPRAVGVARSSLRAVLSAHRLPELVDRAELLVSEMLTNAVLHTSGRAELHLRWREETLRLSVWDTSPKPPDHPHEAPDCDSEHGRGLRLLGQVADRWSHAPVLSGPFGALTKIVWCEIGRKPVSER